MAIRLTMQKNAMGGLQPVTDADKEVFDTIKRGKGFEVILVQQSARSMKHHQMFWAGLVPLAFEYWEPTGGLVGNNEVNILRMFCKRLDTVIDGPVWHYAKQFLDGLGRSRAEIYQSRNKTQDDFVHWLKLESGHYKHFETPTGRLRVVKSISFNSMSQEQFDVFYKKAFDVCWNLVLRKVFGGDQEKCEQIINEMLAMG